MSRSSRIYFAVFVGSLTSLMLAPLANLEYLQAEPSQIERSKSIVLSVTGSTERAMVLIRSLTLTTEEGIKGRIAIYDDVTTKRPADVAVFYNLSDGIVAITWFDRFGIQRIALDSGILQKSGELEGVFVVLTGGEWL